MKFIPAVQSFSNARLVPYVQYNVAEGKYLLLNPDIVSDSIQSVCMVDCLPSSMIPVMVEETSAVQLTAVKSSQLFELMKDTFRQGGFVWFDQDANGKVQVVMQKEGVKWRTVFFNPDWLMEDDVYIPIGCSDSHIDLRRQMSVNPVNFY